MNEVKLSGNVLSCHISQPTGAFICKIAVPHKHIIGLQTIDDESIFTAILQDTNKVKRIKVKNGDSIILNGYLKLAHKISANGNDHKSLKLYATDIEVVKERQKSKNIFSLH